MTDDQIKTESERDALSIRRNRRTDGMFVAAFLLVIWLVYLVVFHGGVGEYAQGVLQTVLGIFLAILKDMYSFETGTTRSGQAKDDTIKEMINNHIPPIKANIIKVEAPSAVVQTPVANVAQDVSVLKEGVKNEN